MIEARNVSQDWIGATSSSKGRHNMSVKQILPGLYQITTTGLNVFLIDSGELILVDVGPPNNAKAIQKAVQAIGRQITDIRHILVTHCHRDHAGSLAAVKQITGAPAYMHPIGAAAVRMGKTRWENSTPPPNLLAKIIFNTITFRLAHGEGFEPAAVEYEVQDGDVIPIAGGIRAIHVPGHSGGQLAFLWEKNGGVLFVAEAAFIAFSLGPPFAYEDFEEVKGSLAKIAALDFDTACFCHGKTIVHGASDMFKQKWGTI
jgi:glyoxylase-like metal-dependent hydrolase (beta-lactamase superfamily II)